MSRSDSFYIKLHELIQRWETWLASVENQPRPDREEGFIQGFQAALDEIRVLYAQVYGLPQDTPLNDDAPDINIPHTPDREEPAWEYLYVTFEKTDTGEWMIDTINGVPSNHAHILGNFSDAVAHLRDQGNWRLTNVAQGIHVFRRPRTP